MHKVSSRTAPRARSLFNVWADQAPSLRYLGLWGLGAGMIILAIAWVDGGEEPIHPIIERADAPTGASE